LQENSRGQGLSLAGFVTENPKRNLDLIGVIKTFIFYPVVTYD
jgi:hypothetical protein